VTDLGESARNQARNNLPELPNTTIMVFICRVSNGKDIVLSPNQLHVAYTHVRHWEELSEFINKNGRLKEPYTQTSRFKCTLGKDELDEEYIELYTNGHRITDPIYGQISYNCCLSNAVKLKTGTQYEHMFRRNEVSDREADCQARNEIGRGNPPSRVKARCAQLLFIIYRLWKVLPRVEESRERRMVGKRMIFVLM
jgi:hypothetical protein